MKRVIIAAVLVAAVTVPFPANRESNDVATGKMIVRPTQSATPAVKPVNSLPVPCHLSKREFERIAKRSHGVDPSLRVIGNVVCEDDHALAAATMPNTPPFPVILRLGANGWGSTEGIDSSKNCWYTVPSQLRKDMVIC